MVVLSDSYLANSAEPWSIPDVAALPRQDDRVRQRPAVLRALPSGIRETLARGRGRSPGTPGLEHRIGGLSKDENSGNVSYDPRNNERMQQLRFEKVARIANEIPPVEVNGPERGDLVVVGWGGTAGAIASAVDDAREDGLAVSSVHLRHLNPFPSNLQEVLSRFERVLVPELNAGQLSRLLRAEFLIPAKSLPKLQGLPFQVTELRAAIDAALQEDATQ